MKKEWTVPETFPDLSSAKIVSVDIETRDDDLKTKGPGVRRGAYIVGVAVGTDDGFRGYYPVAHDEGPNLNKRAVYRWLKKELRRPNQIKLGANILYDIDFLTEQKIIVKGPWYDVQVAEPLIDENSRGHYNLGDLAKKYLQQRKMVDVITEECKRRGYRGDPRKHLWRLPASLVGSYAETDVDLPLNIFPEQKKILLEEDTWDLFLMEMRLTPLLLQMRRQGVRLDAERLDLTIKKFERRLKKARSKLKSTAGIYVEYWAAASIAKAFDRLGLGYALTPKTRAPSFTKELLQNEEHPIAKTILECRALDKFIETFLKGQMRDQMINGRIHSLFNQLKSDEYGTTTGRLSSSHPNLQFIPTRDPELGPLCRSMFIPEDGHLWGKADYSQVEFRIFAHYARGNGADEFRTEYQKDPHIDYHQWCAEEAGIQRGPAKTTNFAVIYGVGLNRLAEKLDVSVDDARAFLERYHAKLPFVKHTLQTASKRAAERGYIRTILNRRRRFTTWEPVDWELSHTVPFHKDKSVMIALVEHAIKKARKNGDPLPRPGVRRAETYKALNALIQGSAADLMKKAMVDAYEAGLFDVLPLHLTVHDELDNSVPLTDRGKEAWRELVHVMENAVPFRVPVVVDATLGKNWGKLE